MILTKLLCRLGWHDKQRSVTFWFNEQRRPVKTTIVTCHDCAYRRQTDTFDVPRGLPIFPPPPDEGDVR